MPRSSKKPPELKLGDLVGIRHTGNLYGRIVELRGPLGPNGAAIYRVRILNTLRRTPIEVRADQLFLLPNEEGAAT